MSEKIPVPIGPKGIELKDLDQMWRFADCYIQSGLAPAGIDKAQQMVIIWARAAELGIAPMQAMEGMAVIKNKVTIMGDLALAIVRSSGLLVGSPKKVYKGSGADLECTVTIQREGSDPASASFSLAQARIAKLPERNINYTYYPERMLYYRCLGFLLRDEFSDILKNMHISEEVADYPTTEINEEAKIASNQSREADITEKLVSQGVTVVEQRGARPTPAEAAEPAFPEDKEKPLFGERLAEDYGAPPPMPAAQNDQQLPDDLDMTAPAPPPEPEPTPWKDHVILGLKDKRFNKRTVGDLNQMELNAIASQWVPKVKGRWNDATPEQQTDSQMIEAAIAWRLAHPW